MSLDKAIASGKERRKNYRGSKAVDRTCRNRGSCPYCRSNREHCNKKRIKATQDDLTDYFDSLKEV